MNIVVALVTGIVLTIILWTMLTGGVGEAISRKLCGVGLESVPCALVGVATAYVLPPLAGTIGGIVVWLKLSQKNRK